MTLTDEEYHQRYQAALNLYFANKYIEAIKEFKDLLKRDAINEYSDNCQYWIAEAYYSQELYDEALVEFSQHLHHHQFENQLRFYRLLKTEVFEVLLFVLFGVFLFLD